MFNIINLAFWGRETLDKMSMQYGGRWVILTAEPSRLPNQTEMTIIGGY